MKRMIINNPHTAEQVLETYGATGYYDGDDEHIVWDYEEDGEPPVPVTLGQMERVEKIEQAVDSNGKRLYEYVMAGETKQDRKRSLIRHKVVYLRNNRLGKIAKSNRKPTKLAPEL